jgi:hypothetical protein
MPPEPITTLTSYECEMLEAGRALDLREARGDAVHLQIRNGKRHWLMRSEHGQLTAEIADSDLPKRAGVHLPLSDRIASFTRRLHGHEPTLALVGSTTTSIGAGTARASIDLVPWAGPAPTAWPVRTTATAALPVWRLARVLNAARVMPTGIDDQQYPMPPMQLQIDHCGVGLHVDWGDFLPSRAIYHVTASNTVGSGSVCVPHRRLDEFLRSLGPEHLDDVDDVDDDRDDDRADQPVLQIAIGELARSNRWEPAVVLTHRHWQLALFGVDVLADRWADDVCEHLQPFDIVHADRTEWLLDAHHRPVRVQLRHGRPDVVRVSSDIGSGLHESVELLRELGTLNAASHGVRFWFHDHAIAVAYDLPCTRLDHLADAVRAVGEAASTYEPLLTAWW